MSKPSKSKTKTKSNPKSNSSHKSQKTDSAPKVSEKPQPEVQKEDVMSETTQTPQNPENSNTSPATEGQPATKGKKDRKPMGTVQERLVEKAENIKAEALLMLKLALSRGAPEGTTKVIQNLLAESDMALGATVELKNSDWQPTDKKKAPAPLKTIEKGAKIVILKDYAEKYSYIPITAELVAADVTVAGRFTQVLLKSGDTIYGWASRSHVDLAP